METHCAFIILVNYVFQDINFDYVIDGNQQLAFCLSIAYREYVTVIKVSMAVKLIHNVHNAFDQL